VQHVMTWVWSVGEVYACGDPDCSSEVLVLRGPRKDFQPPMNPRCVCGSILELRGTVEAVYDQKPHSSGLVENTSDQVRE
jgi:hypothetical protein